MSKETCLLSFCTDTGTPRQLSLSQTTGLHKVCGAEAPSVIQGEGSEIP